MLIKNKYKEVNTCNCCGLNKLEKVLDLGNQPLANNYLVKPVKADLYPLQLNVCPECWHSQLSIAVNPDEMFKDYAYLTGTNRTIIKYFDTLLDIIGQNAKFLGKSVSLLEIASNDGSFLNCVSTRFSDWHTFGVEPAKNIIDDLVKKYKGYYAESSNSYFIGPHTIKCDYWKPDLFYYGTFDIIVAQNVFAHVDDCKGFLNTCKDNMYNNSLLYIQTSQAKMIENGEWDTNYHEHSNFFTVNSMKTIVESCGLALLDVKIMPIHGQSYLFIIGRPDNTAFIKTNSVEEMLSDNELNGLYKIDTYKSFEQKALDMRDNFREKIIQFKEMGCKVIGAGAAAKGTTVMNFCLTENKYKLDYIIDETPTKLNKYIPGVNIPIFKFDHLRSETQPIIIVLLAWNFADELMQKINDMQLVTQPKFIKYFPTFEII